MLHRSRDPIDLPYVFGQVAAVGEGAPTDEQKLELVRAIRNHSKEAAQQLDEFLVDQVARLKSGLREARDNQGRLQALLEKMAMPPWHPATFLGMAEAGRGDAAMVMLGGNRRIVGLAESVDPSSLQSGDEVLLSHELNAILARSPYACVQGGEIGVFDRRTEDGRLVLRSRDEEIVVSATDRLRQRELRAGDRLRWDRAVWMAFEWVAPSNGEHQFLEETPTQTFAAIGGLDTQIEMLQRSIRLHAHKPELARKYRLQRLGAALLVGPPGTGKTMMARALANWLAGLSPSGRAHFMNIKPGGLHSVWYSQSEANYREAFRVAREAGEREPEVPVVMFFDEIDSIGATRGDSALRVDDRVLEAFMAELDGLEARGNVLVVGATNRRSALDPALLRPGRFGDLVVEVPRPNMNAAREIFARHLPPEIPYGAGDPDRSAADARAEIIEAAAARIYAPNGGGDVANLTFRDGKRRTIGARDLISGAVIAKVTRAAVERACVRELETGVSGVRGSDLLEAMTEEFECAARALTPANCHQYFDDLPADLAVARVESIQRRVRHPHRYLDVA